MASIFTDFLVIFSLPSTLEAFNHTLFFSRVLFFSNYFHLFCPYGKDHWDFISACATLIPNEHLQHLLLEVVAHEHSYSLTTLIVIIQVSKVTQNIAIAVNIPDAVAEVAYLFQTRA